MSTPVSQLLVRIAADTGALVRGGKKSERALDGIGRHADAATKKMAALSVAAAAAAGAALFAMAKHAANVAAEIGKMADMAGVSAETLQELNHAARKAGVGFDALVDGLKELQLRADEFAVTGKGPAAEAFARLGMSREEVEERLVDPADMLQTIIDRLGALDKAAQIRILDETLGGTAGEQFIRFVEAGAAGMQTWRQEARKLGIVISDEMIAKSRKASAELETVGQVLTVAGMNIAVEFLPVMQQIAQIFTSPEFIAGIRDTSTALGEAITWMTENLDTVQRFSAAIAGISLGARFGAAGALAGGVAGAAFGPRAFDSMFGGDDHALSLAEGGIDIGAPEQLQEKLDERAAMWTTHLDTMAQVTTEANSAAESSELAHQAKLTEIAKRAAEDRADADRQEMFGRLNATANFFGDLASLAEAAGDDAFKQQKMLAIAAALIGSIESATHAFNWGTKIGGPVLGAAFAAAATAAQVARVAQIKAVQPGSGGTASGGGGFSAPATPAQAANSQQTLLVQGIDANSLWRGDNVRDLAERLIEFQENGGRVVVQ